MRHWLILGAVVPTVILTASLARADDLSDCLLAKTSPGDRAALVKWMFGALSVHPDVKVMASITAAEREDLNRGAASLVQRLMTVDCRKETVYAMKFQGVSAIKKAYGTLGEVAMTGLISDPSVQAGLDVNKYLDARKFEELGKEIAK